MILYLSGVFALMIAVATLKYVSSKISKAEFTFLFKLGMVIAASSVFMAVVILTYSGVVAPWSGRLASSSLHMFYVERVNHPLLRLGFTRCGIQPTPRSTFPLSLRFPSISRLLGFRFSSTCTCSCQCSRLVYGTVWKIWPTLVCLVSWVHYRFPTCSSIFI